MPKLVSKSKCIGVGGSRRRDGDYDFRMFLKVFDRIHKPGDTLVSGGCPQGGDRFAEAAAKAWGLTITIHYPDWKGKGRIAGFLRNTKVAEQCDVFIAVVAEDRTGGTEDAVKKVLKLGKKVYYA